MKNYFLYIFSLTFICGFSQNKISKSNDLNNTPSISFTENKGQISDQNYKARPDVLFSGTDGQLTYHLKNNGISYQLNRVDSWKKEDTLIYGSKFHKEKAMLVPDKSTIYRIDINWLNANKNTFIKKKKALAGYNNYYLESCPNGALEVRSYEEITYQQIYKGIDLKWYQKGGHLKYDYIVAAGADYTQIQLEIKGAEKLLINKKGELIIETPLGDIIEGAPIVYQNNKQLNSKWKIKNNILSFEIENFDPKLLMIIDPNVCTRLWGTYYGGGNADYSLCSVTDSLTNVYISGSTQSINSIASSGAYQVTYGGNYDAFVAKFDPSGLRIWGTYYGGNDIDEAYGCCVDPYFNVFITGSTLSNTGNVIATPGSFQPTHANAGFNDAFLIKFNSNGIRQWGTYYGDSIHDRGYSCSSDKTGNIFVTGYASALNAASSVFGTPGVFQPSIGPLTGAAFIAKFNTNGNRLWSSYLGPNGPSVGTEARFCVADKDNNVFLTGLTNAPTNTLLASPGAHQSFFAGYYDAFLAKFDSVGNRLWSTFYGGPGLETGLTCATDAFGNVYFCGEAGGATNNTVIATPGSHQPTNGGGTDAYLVKFNNNGIRQWGTFYGGTSQEVGYSCSTNLNGDVFLSGSTSSPASISTPGTHQTSLSFNGTVDDGFLVKFNSNCLRQWGTYYGGLGIDRVFSNPTDVFGNIYITGFSTSTASIATPLSHQSTQGFSGDGFLVKFTDCTTALTPGAISGSINVCPGTNQSYSIAPVLGASSYTWSLPNGWTGTSTTNTIGLIPMSTGVLSVAATNTCGYGNSQTLTISTLPAPFIFVNNGNICLGQSFTMSPSGATSYTYSNGSAITTPPASTNYSVTGTGTNGCISLTPAISTVIVNPLPVIAVNNGTICAGQSFTLTPNGANTYTYSSGTAVVNPLITTNYSVTGTSTAGCVSSSAAIANIAVNALPIITVSNGTICAGDSYTINAGGANTYTYSGGSDIVSPTSTTVYSVTGTSSAGCISAPAATLTLTVNSLPVITAGSGSICAGDTFTINASGANTYTYSGGSAIVSPTSTSIYSVTGTSTAGCVSASAAVLTLTVNSLPVVTTNSGTICAGQSFIIVPGGANTYTVSGGLLIVNPTASTNYTVNGTNTAGCTNTNVAISTVSVNPLPAITLNTSDTILCIKETSTLTAFGAVTYTWSTGTISSTETVMPNSTTNYTVTGTDANGCENTAVITQSVYACLGIEKQSSASNNIKVYPNPTSGNFTIELTETAQLTIYNALGQMVYNKDLTTLKTEISLLEFSKGLYYLRVSDKENVYTVFKLVKE